MPKLFGKSKTQPVLEDWAVNQDNPQVWEDSPDNQIEEPAIPSLSALLRIRRVSENSIEDFSGIRYGVWRIHGSDPYDSRAEAGWLFLLNAVEFPFQVLIRQHAPDYYDLQRAMLSVRPEHMNSGHVGRVCDSLLSYLDSMEDSSGVVSRRRYVICRHDRFMEMESALLQANLSFERMDSVMLEQLLQACISGMGAGYTDELFQCRERSGHIELNERQASFWDVSKWPRRVSFLFLEQLLRLGEEMDISLWIWPVSQRESHTLLQTQKVRFEGARLTALQQGKLVNPEVEMAIADASRISDGVERGISRLYRRTMTVGVYGRNRQALRESEERMQGYFRSNLAKVQNLKFRQSKGFASVMPALRKGNGGMDLTDTDTMVCLFPFSPPDMDSREGILLGMDLRSSTPAFVDAFSPAAMNGHMVVMARSGAGKSYFTKLRVFREAARSVPVYLIDPEGEYGVITRTLGGEVLIPGSPGYGLNPFVVVYTGEGDLARRVASLRELVCVMLEGNVDQYLKASIDRCLSRFYADELSRCSGSSQPVLGNGGISDFYDFLLTDVAKEWGGERLAHLLSPFATGSSRFLMQGDARNLFENEAPVTSFNLKNLPSSLKPVATSVCAEVVWGLAVSDPRPRMLVVDECWTVLATPSGAAALLTIVKRARKYFLGLMAITQDVQDFLAEDASAGLMAGHTGRSLLQNSALKLAFQQDPAALPLVCEALGLSEDVREMLAGAMRGQGVLVDSNGSAYPIEVVSTDEEAGLLLDRAWLLDGSETANSSIMDTNTNLEGDDALVDRLLHRIAVESQQEIPA